MDNLKIIVAGPGAGKTHNLTDLVIDSLQNLKKNRYCAVITYTNAATDELRKRISTKVPLPPNVFIGTIHSFLIRFIIEPYGHLLDKVPINKHYIDNIDERPPKKKNIIQCCLAKHGSITYDKIPHLAVQIMETRTVCKTVINRVQYLYVDEYQDSDKNSHKVFSKLIKGIEQGYIIGDKLQYLYEFKCKRKKKQCKDLSETPFAGIVGKYSDVVTNLMNNYNYRSSIEIVSLINRYIIRGDSKQTSNRGSNSVPIYYIDFKQPSDIYRLYREIASRHQVGTKHIMNAGKTLFKEMILTREWIDKVSSCKKSQQIYNTINKDFLRLEKGSHRLTSTLQEVSRCILGVTGKHKKDFIKSTYDELEFRKFCLTIARFIKSHSFTDKEECVAFIQNEVNKKYGSINKNNKIARVDDVLKDLMSCNNSNHLSSNESVYSTIHSSKGLEATSVLAIAYSNTELEKWFDFEAANRELDDVYRLGYVAFSRARDLLCIACLEEISEHLRDKFKSLNIVIVPESNEGQITLEL